MLKKIFLGLAKLLRSQKSVLLEGVTFLCITPAFFGIFEILQDGY